MKVRELLEIISTMDESGLDKDVVFWGQSSDELSEHANIGVVIEVDPRECEVWPQPDGLHISVYLGLAEDEEEQDQNEEV